MHKHKQSQCKRKVKHRKNVMGLIIFCITVCIVFMFAYYQNLRKEISVRQEWLETVLTREKKWILENQGPEGEIYMNGSKAGDVNPYFACMAALGLLAETKNCPMTETEQKLLAGIWTGILGFCWKQMEKWESTGKRVGNLFIKKRLIPKTDILVCTFFLWENIWKRQKVQTCRNPGKWNQPCIKKDSKPDAGWNYTGFRRKHNSLSDG